MRVQLALKEAIVAQHKNNIFPQHLFVRKCLYKKALLGEDE
jgi:hypothetical protein